MSPPCAPRFNLTVLSVPGPVHSPGEDSDDDIDFLSEVWIIVYSSVGGTAVIVLAVFGITRIVSKRKRKCDGRSRRQTSV